MNNKYKNFDLPAGSLKNKTGSWRNFRPIVDVEKCINCGVCESFCPEDCILQKADNPTSLKLRGARSLKGKFYEADLDYCKGCGICAEVCPVKCISMQKE